MNHAMPIIIYGPQGCGKTINAAALAKFYGKTVITEHDGRADLRSYGSDTLVLTNLPLPGAINFDDAMHAARVSESSSSTLDKPMTHTAYEDARKESELIEELTRIVDQQVYGEMDWVRARAYWKIKLPMIDPALLAGALAQVLCMVHANRDAPSRYGSHRPGALR